MTRTRAWPAVVATVLLLSVGTSVAAPPEATPAPQSTPAAGAMPAPSPTPVSRVTRQLLNKKLDLPAYARYGTDPFETAELPHFSETVEVVAKPMDTESLTAKMKWWMDDFEPLYAGTGRPAAFHAPTLAEMREYRPSPPQSADFSLLAGWLLGKLTNKDKSK